MRAVVLRSHGGPDVLQFEDVASPIIGEQDILVTVAATALNRADLLQRMGFYPNPFPSGPEIPGLEFAGTVAAIGEKVTAWSVGDHVMGITAVAHMQSNLPFMSAKQWPCRQVCRYMTLREYLKCSLLHGMHLSYKADLRLAVGQWRMQVGLE
jgi:NADPH:quinone reductase-like Zn-dependent oxidoreductase